MCNVFQWLRVGGSRRGRTWRCGGLGVEKSKDQDLGVGELGRFRLEPRVLEPRGYSLKLSLGFFNLGLTGWT